MVAKITIPKSIHAALNYNEKKVQQGQAACLHAGNYLVEAKHLNFYQKLEGFERLNSLNTRAATKTLHVSLNFDPSENIGSARLVEIAENYMEKIGFGQQPYLVYRHSDAGHPHIHIVSNTIRENGSRINTHNIGRNQSEKARKEIELSFGLVRAERQQRSMPSQLKPVNVSKIDYGTTDSKRAVSNVVNTVFNTYIFTSFPEFNAALKQFNVVADRGTEGSRIHRHHGLVYRILDKEGHSIGVPIKASSISSNPTLANLDLKYEKNIQMREDFMHKTKNVIEQVLELSQPSSVREFVNLLEKQQVYALLRQNNEGRIYGITFVDNTARCVFNGSDLGKQFTAAGIQKRLTSNPVLTHTTEASENHKNEFKAKTGQKNSVSGNGSGAGSKQQKKPEIVPKNENLLDTLLSPKEELGNTPFQLLNKKRKKKRKNL